MSFFSGTGPVLQKAVARVGLYPSTIHNYPERGWSTQTEDEGVSRIHCYSLGKTGSSASTSVYFYTRSSHIYKKSLDEIFGLQSGDRVRMLGVRHIAVRISMGNSGGVHWASVCYIHSECPQSDLFDTSISIRVADEGPEERRRTCDGEP